MCIKTVVTLAGIVYLSITAISCRVVANVVAWPLTWNTGAFMGAVSVFSMYTLLSSVKTLLLSAVCVFFTY